MKYKKKGFQLSTNVYSSMNLLYETNDESKYFGDDYYYKTLKLCCSVNKFQDIHENKVFTFNFLKILCNLK